MGQSWQELSQSGGRLGKLRDGWQAGGEWQRLSRRQQAAAGGPRLRDGKRLEPVRAPRQLIDAEQQRHPRRRPADASQDRRWAGAAGCARLWGSLSCICLLSLLHGGGCRRAGRRQRLPGCNRGSRDATAGLLALPRRLLIGQHESARWLLLLLLLLLGQAWPQLRPLLPVCPELAHRRGLLRRVATATLDACCRRHHRTLLFLDPRWQVDPGCCCCCCCLGLGSLHPRLVRLVHMLHR